MFAINFSYSTIKKYDRKTLDVVKKMLKFAQANA
jgi:hypothetical protein